MAFLHLNWNVWRFYIWFRTTSVFTFKSGIAVFFTFKSGNRAFLIKIQTNGVSTLVSPETLSRHWPEPSGRGRGVSNFQSFSRKCFSVKKQSERKKNLQKQIDALFIRWNPVKKYSALIVLTKLSKLSNYSKE